MCLCNCFWEVLIYMYNIRMQGHNMQPAWQCKSSTTEHVCLHSVPAEHGSTIGWVWAVCLSSLQAPPPSSPIYPALKITWLNPTDGQYSLQWDFSMCTPAPAGNLATTIITGQNVCDGLWALWHHLLYNLPSQCLSRSPTATTAPTAACPADVGAIWRQATSHVLSSYWEMQYCVNRHSSDYIYSPIFFRTSGGAGFTFSDSDCNSDINNI